MKDEKATQEKDIETEKQPAPQAEAKEQEAEQKPEAEPKPEEAPKTEEPLFTQADVDRIVKERLAREAKKASGEQARTDNAAKEQIAGLQAQVADLQSQVRAYQAKSVLADLNVKPGREDALVKLADLSELDGKSGREYESELKEIMADLVKEYPEFIEQEDRQGFIKAGTARPAADQPAGEDILRQQIRKGFGLK